MDDTTEAAEVTALRAVAHPVRLRMLSLLTGEAMSAAEVARALDLTHANASYHLRVLHDAGEVVVESEEKVRGGTARRYRYRYDPAADKRRGPRDAAARIAAARATQVEVERRLLEAAPGSGSASDLEAWVPVEAWRRALELVHEASMLLHDEARPPGSPDTVHVSATWTAFTMTGGLTGEAAGWRP